MAGMIEPFLDLDRIEPEQVPPLQVRDSPLGHQPPNVPHADPKELRHLLDSQ
jgi:hypothetical protein